MRKPWARRRQAVLITHIDLRDVVPPETPLLDAALAEGSRREMNPSDRRDREGHRLMALAREAAEVAYDIPRAKAYLYHARLQGVEGYSPANALRILENGHSYNATDLKKGGYNKQADKEDQIARALKEERLSLPRPERH